MYIQKDVQYRPPVIATAVLLLEKSKLTDIMLKKACGVSCAEMQIWFPLLRSYEHPKKEEPTRRSLKDQTCIRVSFGQKGSSKNTNQLCHTGKKGINFYSAQENGFGC